MNPDVETLVKCSKAPLKGGPMVEGARNEECLYSTKEMEAARQDLDEEAKAYLRASQRSHDLR